MMAEMSRKDKINRKEIDQIDYTPCCESTASDGRGRALHTGPLRKDAQKYVKISWHGTI